MKKIKSLSAQIVCILISLIGVIIIDSKLFYFGKNEFNSFLKLPFDVKPEYWGYNKGQLGFVLTEKEGNTLVAKGVKYWESSLEVSELIRYGFNNTKIVVVVTDSIGHEFYIDITRNKEGHSNQLFKIRIVPSNEYSVDFSLQWINIKGVSTTTLERLRGILLIFIFFIFISIFLGWWLKNNGFMIKLRTRK